MSSGKRYRAFLPGAHRIVLAPNMAAILSIVLEAQYGGFDVT